MHQIIEQAKQYFLGKEFGKALKIIEDNLAEICPEKLDYAYDLAGCSNFMLKNYNAAITYFDKAIQLNPDVTDFYISKAAALRKNKSVDESVYILSKVAEKTDDPAINYNIKSLSCCDDQALITQTELMSEHECFNQNYDKWDGIVPSFLKAESARSDKIFKKEEELLAQISAPITEQTDLSEHLEKLAEEIELREIRYSNYGIKLKEISTKLFPVVRQIVKNYRGINTKIILKSQKKELMNKLIKILTIIKENPQDAEQIRNNLLINLSLQIKICCEKEMKFYKNRAAFEQDKSGQILCEKAFNYSGTDQIYIQIAVTEENFLIYVDGQFMRFLTPTRSLAQLKKLPVETAKMLFNLYWFMNLRIILACQEGIDLSKYFTFHRGFSFIYSEIDEADQYKYQSNELIEKSIAIFQKYNEMYNLKFLPEVKKENILKNCLQFKNYLSEADETFETILKNNHYVDILTKDPQDQDSIAQQKSFRDYYWISGSMEDRIAEILILIFYHFRNPCKTHQLMLNAFVEMAIQSKDTLNGKESFYKNFYDSVQPKPTFLQKFLKLIN